MPITIEELQAGLVKHDKGVLKRGAHKHEDREYCALEFVAVMHDEPLNDKPGHLPDIRPLNDARWSSDESRTAHMLPVLVALWDWATWTPTRKQQWASRVSIEVVRQIVSQLLGLTETIREECRAVSTVDAAARAARAADAADAADAAAGAAYAARAARAARAEYAAGAAYAA